MDLSSHAALTKKRKIFGSKAVVWYADRLYMPYTFRIIHERKEESKKKKNNKIKQY